VTCANGWSGSNSGSALPRKDLRVSDELERWAAPRAEELIARAEAEVVAELRAALLRAVSAGAAASPTRTPDLAPRTAERATHPPADAGTLLWAYCVTHPDDQAPLGPSGLGGDVEWIERGGLAAAVSRVPAGEYGEEALHESLNDLEWLERVARVHETVLERAGERTTIVPLRLCTIFADVSGVQHMLEANRQSLTAALERLAGRQEWAVKLLVDPERLEAACGPGDATTTAGSGTTYLLGRKAERERRAAAERLGRELAENVHARLQDWAIDAVVNPPQSRELSGHVGEMLLNGAYLVESARAEELRALATELEERHAGVDARLEVTGPLPPFNFVPPPERDPRP
jgi:hypothetical protein